MINASFRRLAAAAAGFVWLALAHAQSSPGGARPPASQAASQVKGASSLTVAGNRALGTTSAVGVQADIGAGRVARLQASGVAQANGVDVAAASIDHTRLSVLGNQTLGFISAVGGVAVANSIRFDQGSSRATEITIGQNTARDIRASGGSGSIAGGLVGSVERSGRALANALAVSDGGSLARARVTMASNSANSILGNGAGVAANSVLVDASELRDTRVSLYSNSATNVQATGFQSSVAGGAIYASSQESQILVNSVGAFQQSVIASPSITLASNRAQGLMSNGGQISANSAMADGQSRLTATVDVHNNEAQEISTTARSTSSLWGLIGSRGAAHASINSVTAVGDATVSGNIALAGNSADRVNVTGGMALVNSLMADRRAMISGSAVTIAGNHASTISASGERGAAVANAIHLASDGNALLGDSYVSLRNNRVSQIGADGGAVNANALSIQEGGNVQRSDVSIDANDAANLSASDGGSRGSAINANSLQVLGGLHDSSVQLTGNATAAAVSSGGAVLSNGMLIDNGAQVTQSQVRIARNLSGRVSAQAGQLAAVNSVASSGKLTGVQVDIEGNSGEVLRSGVANSLVNSGSIGGSRIRLSSNQGHSNRGAANSVLNAGNVVSSNIVVMNNLGVAGNGGAVNSVINGTRGHIENARIAIVRNTGSAVGIGGAEKSTAIANSIVNNGRLSGQVLIVDNQAVARGDGVINSLINHGEFTGKAQISGNHGVVSSGAIANSIINRGSISGTVNIIGRSASGTGGNVVVGGRGSAGGIGSELSPTTGVISNSVTVVPGG